MCLVSFSLFFFQDKSFFAYALNNSKVSIIRPGYSRLLKFEKKDSTSRVINKYVETFQKIQTRTFNNWDSKQVNKWNSTFNFFWDGTGRLIETFEKIARQDVY